MDRQRMPLICVGVVLALAGTALADGVVRNGLGARSIGRGGTNIAHSDNGEIVLDNPAATVNTEGEGLLEVGVDLLMCDLDYSDPVNNVSAHHNPFPMGQAAWIKKSANGRWAYGLGFFAPAGFAATYDMEGPFPFPGTRRYKSIGSLAKALPVVAHRFTDRLSIGGTLGVAISHMELEGPYTLQGPNPFRGLPTLLDLQHTGAALCWSAGMQYALSEATTFGLTYQSESRFFMDGNTRVEVPIVGQIAYDSRLDVVWPQSVGLGLRHELCPHRVLSTDLIWFDWSQAFDNFKLHLANASNPLFPDLEEHFPLDWRDSLSVRVGYEHLFDGGLSLRFGYVYHPNPIPDGTLSPYIQAIVEHSFSTGLGVVWRKWNIDLAYMFCFGPERFVGQSDWVGGDFDLSRDKAQVHEIALSFMRRF